MRLVLVLVLALATAAGAQLGVPRPVPLASFTPITTFPMATRAAGTYSFNPVAVPTGVSGLSAVIDVTQATDPLPTMTVILEGSRDGGATWQSAGSFNRAQRNKGQRPPSAGGGTQTEITASFFGGTFWDDTANANRRLRGVATITLSMRFSMVVQPL